MTRLLITAAGAIALFGAPAAAAHAKQGASPASSCVGLISSFEATQLPAGSVGEEVAGLASTPGLGHRFVRPLAHEHPGSLENCA